MTTKNGNDYSLSFYLIGPFQPILGGFENIYFYKVISVNVAYMYVQEMYQNLS